jgi:hypothetical protein
MVNLLDNLVEMWYNDLKNLVRLAAANIQNQMIANSCILGVAGLCSTHLVRTYPPIRSSNA